MQLLTVKTVMFVFQLEIQFKYLKIQLRFFVTLIKIMLIKSCFKFIKELKNQFFFYTELMLKCIETLLIFVSKFQYSQYSYYLFLFLFHMTCYPNNNRIDTNKVN